MPLFDPAFESHAERRAFMFEYGRIFDAWTSNNPGKPPFHPEDVGPNWPSDAEDHGSADHGEFDALVDELIRTWPERWAQIQAGRAQTN